VLSDPSGHAVSGTFSVSPGINYGSPNLLPFATESLLYAASDGGLGHVTLTSAGGTCPGSATLTQSSAPLADVKVCYDGHASPPYYATIGLNGTVSNVDVTSGNPPIVAPLIVATSANALTGLNSQATLTAFEAYYPQGDSFYATPESGCSGISLNQQQVQVMGGENASGSFYVTQTGATGSCTIDVSDESGALVKVAFAGTSSVFTITIGQ
jgi:hypothetical protein